MLTLLTGLVASSTPFGSDASCAQPSFRVRSLMAPSCAPAPSPAPDAAECGDVDAQLATVRQAAQPSQPGQRWRVALCFYSLTRSLKLTLPSIKRHVLGPLRRTRRATVEIFLHTYNMSRGGCNGCVGSVPLDWRADVAALAEALPRHMPMRVQVDDQSQLIRRLGSEHTDAFATTWRADGEALGVAQFYLAALHSLKRVTAMWHTRAKAGEPYHLVCLLRPDLVYLDPLPVAGLLAAGARDARFLAVPPRLFQAGKWVDDKFAIGAPRAALLYGNRVDALMAFMRAHPGKLSESYLGWHVHAVRDCVNTLPMTTTPMRNLRLRGTGVVNCKDVHFEYGLALPCKRCQVGAVPNATARRRVAKELSRANLSSAHFASCFPPLGRRGRRGSAAPSPDHVHVSNGLK